MVGSGAAAEAVLRAYEPRAYEQGLGSTAAAAAIAAVTGASSSGSGSSSGSSGGGGSQAVPRAQQSIAQAGCTSILHMQVRA